MESVQKWDGIKVTLPFSSHLMAESCLAAKVAPISSSRGTDTTFNGASLDFAARMRLVTRPEWFFVTR